MRASQHQLTQDQVLNTIGNQMLSSPLKEQRSPAVQLKSNSKLKASEHKQLSQAIRSQPAECVAKMLQKQFPLIKLEQSLLVNGCMSTCPIHGQQSFSQTGVGNSQAIQNSG